MNIQAKLLLIFFAFVIMCPELWARIGETQQQCEERYGVPKEGFGEYIYTFKNRDIRISFEGGKAVRITYSVGSWEDAAELLGKNDSGKWRDVPATEEKNMFNAHLHFYESSDGLLQATYSDHIYPTLTVKTVAFARAEQEAKEARDKKAKADEEAKKKDSLEGL
jgi:hypothetical protein